MKIIKPLLFTFAMLLGANLSAQNAHWTLYDMAPTFTNAATTGNFLGTARAGIIYRDQWRSSIGSSAFTTPMLYVDAPVLAIGKRDWLGAGLTVWNDQAGVFKRGETGALLSAAYHHALDRKGKNILSFGLQGGSVQQRIDLLNVTTYADGTEAGFQEELNGGTTLGSSADRTNFGTMQGGNGGNNPSFIMINLGATYKTIISKKSDLLIGLAAHGINTDNYSTEGTVSGG